MWTTAGGLLLGTRTHTRTGAMGRGVELAPEIWTER